MSVWAEWEMNWLPLARCLPQGAGSSADAEAISWDKEGPAALVDEEDSVRVRFLNALSGPSAIISPIPLGLSSFCTVP